MTTNRKLIESTGIIGSAITTSRILGFVRDIIFARWFGTSIFAQAFVVAYRIPNMLRDMVGEGATDAAIVPVLTEYRHTRSEEEYWKAARVILNLLLSVLIILSFVGVFFAPVIVRVIAPGFIRDPEKFSTAVLLTRWVFPYILFLGLVAYSKGVLNSLHYFTTPAFAPVILNTTIILALLLLTPIIGIKGVVVGVLLGGVFQVLMQIPPLYSRGFRLERGFQLAHPVAKRIGRLLLPRMLGTTVYQLSVLIDTILASLAWIVGKGGVAALYYSNRLVQLPLAVFGISLATAALPRMSKEVAEKDIDKLKSTVSFSLKTVFAIMVPASIGLMILAGPIVRILFQRGEFTIYSTAITSSALFFYAFGLFAYAGIKILVSTYYSMGDTKTPVKTAAVSLFVNLVFNLILMWPLKIGGLALATSIAATCNFVILYVLLVRRIGDVGTASIVASFGRICGASVLMGIVTFVVAHALLDPTLAVGIRGFVNILITVLASCATYLIAAYIINVEGVRRLCTSLISREK
ncbi:MAG: murein biosynthesis integral membrane protein MurJ [Candidatus Omnitrophota bacterium]